MAMGSVDDSIYKWTHIPCQLRCSSVVSYVIYSNSKLYVCSLRASQFSLNAANSRPQTLQSINRNLQVVCTYSIRHNTTHNWLETRATTALMKWKSSSHSDRLLHHSTMATTNRDITEATCWHSDIVLDLFSLDDELETDNHDFHTIHHILFHSRLKTHLFHKSFPP